MPSRPARPHRAAVTRMLKATGLVHIPQEAPLVELLRSLADELDAGGGSRARAEYLSALKDVRRVLATPGIGKVSAKKAAAKAPDAVDDAESAAQTVPAPTTDDLTTFRARRGIA